MGVLRCAHGVPIQQPSPSFCVCAWDFYATSHYQLEFTIQ